MRVLFGVGLALAIVVGIGCKSEESKSSEKSASALPKLTKLEIKDVQVGDGEKLETGDTAEMRYTGKLADGTVFDSNVGKDTFSFPVGAGQVIQGWDQGVLGMKAHGKRHLAIPSNLAYGPQDKGKIPANSDLYFDIELVSVMKRGDEMKVRLEEDKPGHGDPIKTGDKVTIDYVLKSANGHVVQDSKVDTDATTKKVLGPLTFTVGGKDEVLPAIDEAAKSMKEGGEYTLNLPTQFGPTKMTEDVKPGQPWIVVIKVLKVTRS